MLRSRDTSKNAQRNGILIDEPIIRSSKFTIWGILVCALFTIIVAYFIFMDTNNTNPSNISTKQSSSNSNIPQSLSHPNPPMGQQLSQNNLPKSSRNTFSANPLAHALRPKILSDLNPSENDKLERLMNRQQMLPFKNKFNFHRPGLQGPLKSLTGPMPASQNLAKSDTKEISFVLHASSLPRSKGKQPSIFIRQAYSLTNHMNHEFVLIFLHGAAFSSATWSELGILQSLAQQGYITYALDIPGSHHGQSVPTQPINNKWLKEIIHQLIQNDPHIIGHIKGSGGISTEGKKYILLTASMSGKYAIPLLLEKPNDMIGMITVAPVGTDKFKKEQYEKVSIPVCIIYGEDDTSLGVVSKEKLSQIPNHKTIMVPQASHACYQNNPKFFHQQVVKWLNEFFD